MRRLEYKLAGFLTLAALAVVALVVVRPTLAQQDQEGPNMVDTEQIKDALERSKARGKLIACADPYNWPYSSNGEDPPGFDIEIIRSIAKRANLRLEMYWADTGTRGGIMRAFRNSILAKRCDVFLGLSDNGDDDLLPGSLTFSAAILEPGLRAGRARQGRGHEIAGRLQEKRA